MNLVNAGMQVKRWFIQKAAVLTAMLKNAII